MFGGIVTDLGQVVFLEDHRLLISCLPGFEKDIVRGASVSVDGVCLTVSAFECGRLYFDCLDETLQRSSLGIYQPGQKVHLERALRVGQEIGGHLLSGHIFGTGTVLRLGQEGVDWVLRIQCLPNWVKYLSEKGFVAVDGCSLTLVDVDPKGEFSVHLIPETLSVTHFLSKAPGSLVNVEIDSTTQTVVDTVERYLLKCGYGLSHQ